jgi:uncharacterized protein (DUF58 family)
MVRCPFPLGLVEARSVLGEAPLLVLPRRDRTRAADPGLATSDAGVASRRGDGSDILNIREWRPGDDARRMHWKATARTGTPMMREHAVDEERRAVIVVDVSGAPEEAAEAAIARAAGLAEDLASRGWGLRLLAPGVDASGSVRDLDRALALLDASAMMPPGWWRGVVDPRDAVLVVRAEVSS